MEMAICRHFRIITYLIEIHNSTRFSIAEKLVFVFISSPTEWQCSIDGKQLSTVVICCRFDSSLSCPIISSSSIKHPRCCSLSKFQFSNRVQ